MLHELRRDPPYIPMAKVRGFTAKFGKKSISLSDPQKVRPQREKVFVEFTDGSIYQFPGDQIIPDPEKNVVNVFRNGKHICEFDIPQINKIFVTTADCESMAVLER